MKKSSTASTVVVLSSLAVSLTLSALGGSRCQIGGPTGAFVVVRGAFVANGAGFKLLAARASRGGWEWREHVGVRRRPRTAPSPHDGQRPPDCVREAVVRPAWARRCPAHPAK